MVTQLVFSGIDYDKLRTHLLQSTQTENAAYVIGGVSRSSNTLSLLAREVIIVPDEAFLKKGSAYLAISPVFIARVLKKCTPHNLSVILAHSHPFSDSCVGFSGIDDHGEEILIPKVFERVPSAAHAAMVLGKSSVEARIWTGPTNVRPIDRIKIVGKTLEVVELRKREDDEKSSHSERYSRQVLALGEDGQQKLHGLTVGIVGAGGIGSHVFQQVVHLGVGRVIILDFDAVEESNRSRLIGSAEGDSGTPKVEVLARLGRQINPQLQVEPIVGSVLDRSPVAKLLEADVIFCCTDTMGSRMVLNRIASQYLTPVIDTGIDIDPKNGGIRAIGGRVMLLHPDGLCLDRFGVLNAAAVTAEFVDNLGVSRAGYIRGVDMPAPAVVSLNGVVASLAVTRFLWMVTGVSNLDTEVFHMYDGKQGTVKAIRSSERKECEICSEVRAMGDNIGLPCRADR